MKINEIIVNEGFWDSVKKGVKNIADVAGGKVQGVGTGFAAGLAKGFGTHTVSQALTAKAKQNAAQAKQARNAAQAAIQTQAGAVMKPHPARASNQPRQPAADTGALQPGERFEIIDPKSNNKYYKTNKGWFNQLNQKVTSEVGIDYLENSALQQSGRFIPAPKQKPKLSPKQQRRADAEAARKAAYEPTVQSRPVVYNKPRPQFAEESLEEDTQKFSGFNDWKQEIAGDTAGFAKFKRNEDGDLIASYNGKIIGKWDEFEGTGYVYTKVDTGPTPIVKEMAKRRAKKKNLIKE